MTAFYRDVLQLEVILERPGATWFRLGDGTEVHVYGPGDEDHGFFGSAPVIGFAVDSFGEVHAAMTAAGTEFIYPEPQRAGERAWQHFRGPTETSTKSSGQMIRARNRGCGVKPRDAGHAPRWPGQTSG